MPTALPKSPPAPSTTKDYTWSAPIPSQAQIERFKKFKDSGGEVPVIKGIVMGGHYTDLMKSFFGMWELAGLPTGNGNFPICAPEFGFTPEEQTQLEKDFDKVTMRTGEEFSFVRSKLGSEYDIVSVIYGVPRTRREYADYRANMNAKDGGDDQKPLE